MPKLFREAGAGAFGAIYQGIRDFRSEVAKAKSTGELKKSSIARASKDLVMSFPVLCSDTVSPETAAMICKAVERNSETMLQLLFTSEHLSGTNGRDILAQWHNNIDKNMDITDYMDYAAGAVANAANYGVGGSKIRSANSFFKMGTYTEAADQAQREFKRDSNKFYPESSFSESAVSDFFVRANYNGYEVRKNSVLTEANGRKDEPTSTNKDDLEWQKFKYQKGQEARRIAASNRDYKYRKSKDSRDFDYKRERDKVADARYDAEKNAEADLQRQNIAHQMDQEIQRGRHEWMTRMLLPTDVQKVNELVPSMMVVRFAVQDDKSVETVQEFIAGVKARLIAVPSDEIVDQLSRYNKSNKIDNLQFARATTKEISFAKDFVGAVQQAKLDAKKDALGATSPIWRMLQSRSASSNARRLVHGRNTAAAITTLVITKPEVDYIKSETGVDLSNPKVASGFMQSYNLICLIIVDEQSDVARFLYDGEAGYSNFSFSMLEKENRGNGLSTKDNLRMVNLLHRMS